MDYIKTISKQRLPNCHSKTRCSKGMICTDINCKIRRICGFTDKHVLVMSNDL